MMAPVDAMRELWPVYHPEVPPFLRALMETPPLARLRQVGMNCGCEYTACPRFQALRPYSRFDHSVGVGLIVWHFTGDAAQSIAGLLHDVATPVFAHVVDFLNGDHLRQESTEAATGELIRRSPEIQAILASLGLTTADVADYHRYPIADNAVPRLSADRLEYTLGNLINYGFLSLAQAAAWYSDLTVTRNEDGAAELVFRSQETAAAFTEAALQTARIYVADEDRFIMQALAELLKRALSDGVLTSADLGGTEPDLIRKLTADPVYRDNWARFRALSAVRRADRKPEGGYWLQIPAKLRYIDPLAAGAGRVSQWEPRVRGLLADFRRTRFEYWVGPASPASFP